MSGFIEYAHEVWQESAVGGKEEAEYSEKVEAGGRIFLEAIEVTARGNKRPVLSQLFTRRVGMRRWDPDFLNDVIKSLSDRGKIRIEKHFKKTAYYRPGWHGKKAY